MNLRSTSFFKKIILGIIILEASQPILTAAITARSNYTSNTSRHKLLLSSMLALGTGYFAYKQYQRKLSKHNKIKGLISNKVVGLINRDNRCAVNSLFQLLVPVIQDWLKDEDFKRNHNETTKNNPVTSYLSDYENLYLSKSNSITLDKFHTWVQDRGLLGERGGVEVHEFLPGFCQEWNKHTSFPKFQIQCYSTAIRETEPNENIPRSLDLEMKHDQETNLDWSTKGPGSWETPPEAFFIIPAACHIRKNMNINKPDYIIPNTIDLGPYLTKLSIKKCEYELIGSMVYFEQHDNGKVIKRPLLYNNNELRIFEKARGKTLNSKPFRIPGHVQAIVKNSNNTWLLYCDNKSALIKGNDLTLYSGYHFALLYKKKKDQPAPSSHKTKNLSANEKNKLKHKLTVTTLSPTNRPSFSLFNEPLKEYLKAPLLFGIGFIFGTMPFPSMTLTSSFLCYRVSMLLSNTSSPPQRIYPKDSTSENHERAHL